MVEVKFSKSNRDDKRYKAEFFKDDKKIKTTHFGFQGDNGKYGNTYIDHKNDHKKKAYIARHKKNEDWNDYKTAGSLSKHILWNKPTLEASIKDYKKKFNLK